MVKIHIKIVWMILTFAFSFGAVSCAVPLQISSSMGKSCILFAPLSSVSCAVHYW